MNKLRALIVGCGYLGSQVAKLWCEMGHKVFAVTRSEKNVDRFRQSGWEPIVADITIPSSLEAISRQSFDVVLFAVGFDRTRYNDIQSVYVDGLNNFLLALKDQSTKLIYVSSTGVYGNANGDWVDENTIPDPIRPGGKACWIAEQLIRSHSISPRATILRLAGIYGRQRIPKLDAIRNQKWQELGQSGHVNLIEVSDAAKIINEVIQLDLLNELFLVSDGHPANRRQFYEFIAERIALSPIDWSVVANPEVSTRAASDKRISNKKLVSATQYEFSFPDFRSGLSNALKSAS